MPQNISTLLLEQQIFARTHPQFERFLPFGFQPVESGYIYTEEFLDGDFRAEITVDQNGSVAGSVIEIALDSEYQSIHIPSQQGEFVN